MQRSLFRFGLVALSAITAFSQSNGSGSSSRFEAADVHVSPPSISFHERDVSGGLLPGGRYSLHRATILDLIVAAWGADPEKILGGPSWLEMDRFDILARVPAGVKTESVKPMLQTLLIDRFHLVLHNETKSVPAFALSAGKKLQLERSNGSGDSGCTARFENPPMADGAASGSPIVLYTCHNMAMAAFAGEIRNLIGADEYLGGALVADLTGLAGPWDFTFKYTLRSGVAGTGSVITLFDALDKQVGLKMDPSLVRTAVMVVDKVDRIPTENPPDVTKALALGPVEFEVADIKLAAPGTASSGGFQIQPGGRFYMQASLLAMIKQAWGLNAIEMAGVPDFADKDIWVIVAKGPSAMVEGGEFDRFTFYTMMKNLLKDRFKLAVHTEQRPIMAYTLVAVKPKLKLADPATRTNCKEGPAALVKTDSRDANPLLGRLLTCRNTSMAQLAYLLFHGMASGYVKSPVLDATGLEGGWDFSLSFSAVGQLPSAGGLAGATGAIDPDGTVSLHEAMQKQIGIKMELQKRPSEVLVIDRLERRPTEN
jgi:uncharacterized protein (TIGR03435 family)